MSVPPAALPHQRVLPRQARNAGIIMGTAVSVELVLGIGALISVPYHRSNAVVPATGQAIYLAHAVLGLALGALAMALIPRARRLTRPVWLGAVTGLVGIGVAGVGGALSTVQPTRLIGMGLMLIGSVAAVAGYLMPLVDSVPPDAAA